MKNKVLTKILAVTLAISMVMGLAACGNGGGSTSGGSTDKTEGEISYPMKEAATIDVWATYPTLPESITDYADSPWHTGLEKVTGIKVNWSGPVAGADWFQAFNILLTEEDLPTVIAYPVDVNDAVQLLEDGLIYDLAEYLPKYAPNYWAYINAEGNEQILYDVTADGGRIYGIYSIRENEYNSTFQGPVIRQDWLDECGLDVPVTLEDWENVLVAFNKKYGAKLAFAQNRWSVGISSGVGAKAGELKATQFIDENGKVQLANVQPEYKEMLTWMNRWYKMGLIDEDSFTMADSSMREKALQNKVGLSITAMSQVTAWTEDAEANNTGAKWVGIEYPREAAGVPTSAIQTSSLVQKTCAMITTQSTEDELIAALRWIDYGYSEEGLLYHNFGTEDVSYTVDENGNYVWTDIVKNDPEGLDIGIAKYSAASEAPLSIQLTSFVKSKNNEAAGEAVYKWIENTEANKYIIPNVLSIAEEDSDYYTDTYAVITAKVKEMTTKFIMGQRPLNEFDAFVQELYDLGLQKCLDIQQAAYDRYMDK